MLFRSDTIFENDTKRGVSTHVFNYQTQSGCDSIVTLILTVSNVGVDIVTVSGFDIYPNPTTREGRVILSADFVESELDGSVVEVYNSAGICVQRIKGVRFPVRLSTFDSSGIYVIRVITNSGRVMYGKIVVL